MVKRTERTVFRFDTPAKLIFINAHSSYLELKNNNGNDNKSCLWCSNPKAHEHDILGKIKFDPKEKSYLVSLVQKLKSRKGLEITPSQNVMKEKTDNNVEPKEKIYPVQEVRNEIEGAQYLARCIVRSQGGQVKCAGIKYGENHRHLMTSSPKSVLKTSQTPHSKCDKCMKNDFLKLSEVQLHFMNVHHYNVQIKDVSVKNAPDDEGAFEADNEENAEFICTFEDCTEKFESDEKRIQHMNENHAQRQCHKCLQHFKTPVTFRKHQCGLPENQKVRNHSCHLCSKKFLKAPHLRAHLQTTHMGAKLVCETCDKRYASAFALKTHKVNAHGIGGEKPECPHCPQRRTFCNKTFLRRHILECHEKDTRRSCPICGLYYLRKDKLEAHMVSVHGQAYKPNPCKLCSKVYSTADKLQKHLRTVHGILPWNKVQVLQVTAKPHELKEDVLKCKYCEQAFLPAEMENHLRFSHGVMPITSSDQLTISEAAEALLKTLTPQPDYLLRSLTPLPMETLDELLG